MDEYTDNRRRVVSDWEATYSDPIVVEAGEVVSVSDRETKWDGWRWCIAPDGREGWIPEAYLSQQDGEWVVEADYSAVEVSVEAGETVVSHESLAGWEWCETSSGEEGWVPSENLSA
ncbi:SH3 domain-containing protein (plasmid) [Haloferax sp. S1W]|uniref:SH3 domain-containing protein n=1 Tax=Haloferax sp. S1W TaxID=3377110 RepID=UPI0037CB271E